MNATKDHLVREIGTIGAHIAGAPSDVGVAYLQLTRLRDAIDGLAELAADTTEDDRWLADSRYASCVRLLHSAMHLMERS